MWSPWIWRAACVAASGVAATHLRSCSDVSNVPVGWEPLLRTFPHVVDEETESVSILTLGHS